MPLWHPGQIQYVAAGVIIAVGHRSTTSASGGPAAFMTLATMAKYAALLGLVVLAVRPERGRQRHSLRCPARPIHGGLAGRDWRWSP